MYIDLLFNFYSYASYHEGEAGALLFLVMIIYNILIEIASFCPENCHLMDFLIEKFVYIFLKNVLR
jgi:hypothetical protein